MSSNVRNSNSILAIGCIIILFIVLFIGFVPRITIKFYKDLEQCGQIGDIIGGTTAPIIGISGVILTFLAFFIQYRANQIQVNALEDQKDAAGESDRQNKIQQTEHIFFEMVKLHRQNITEMSFTTYQNREMFIAHRPDRAIGRKVFREIYAQFQKIYEESSPLIDNKNDEEIYEVSYLKELEGNSRLSQIDKAKLAVIDILYLIIFFGVGKDGSKAVRGFLKSKYKSDFYEPIILLAMAKPKKDSIFYEKYEAIFENIADRDKPLVRYKIISEIAMLEKVKLNLDKPTSGNINPAVYDAWSFFTNKYDKYYGGHQFRLGHYFRHFYQTINYVHYSENFDLALKNKYANILRGQISTHEQYLLFLNSLSQLGRTWELHVKKQPGISKSISNQLITQYELIRNVEKNEVVDKINFSDFYPYINYENFDTIEDIDNTRRDLGFYTNNIDLDSLISNPNFTKYE